MCSGIGLLCPAPRVGALSDYARLTSVCHLTSDSCVRLSRTSDSSVRLSRTSGLSQKQRGLGRLRLA